MSNANGTLGQVENVSVAEGDAQSIRREEMCMAFGDKFIGRRNIMLIDKATFVLTLLAALGSGLIAGVFFIFSFAIMRALERITPFAGMWAMQSINIYILNPVFLGVFLGTGIICAYLAISGVVRWHLPGAAWLITGSMLYIVGSIGITVIFNVPMNNALMVADPATPEGQQLWSNYLTTWTFWNHIRMIASLAASASLIVALVWK